MTLHLQLLISLLLIFIIPIFLILFLINNKGYADLAVNHSTDFKDAIITDMNIINYLSKNSCKNIPTVIKNKKELREILQPRIKSVYTIYDLVNQSNIPEN